MQLYEPPEDEESDNESIIATTKPTSKKPSVICTTTKPATTPKPAKKGLKWSASETLALIEAWKPLQDNLKIASNKGKTDIYGTILAKFLDNPLVESNISIDAAQIRSKIRHMTDTYKAIREKGSKCGAASLQKIAVDTGFIFFEELDEFLGTRDANNPALMNICQSGEDPKQPSKKRKGDMVVFEEEMLALTKEHIASSKQLGQDMLSGIQEMGDKLIEAGRQQTKDLYLVYEIY